MSEKLAQLKKKGGGSGALENMGIGVGKYIFGKNTAPFSYTSGNIPSTIATPTTAAFGIFNLGKQYSRMTISNGSTATFALKDDLTGAQLAFDGTPCDISGVEIVICVCYGTSTTYTFS